MSHKFEENPRPLRAAGTPGKQDFSRQKPSRPWIRGCWHHRWIARNCQRTDRPIKNIFCNIDIVDRVAASVSGNVGEPTLIPQGSDIGRCIKHTTVQRLQPNASAGSMHACILLQQITLSQFQRQCFDEWIDSPLLASRRDTHRVAPLVEPIKHLRTRQSLVVVVQMAQHRHGSLQQFVEHRLWHCWRQTNSCGWRRHIAPRCRTRWAASHASGAWDASQHDPSQPPQDAPSARTPSTPTLGRECLPELCQRLADRLHPSAPFAATIPANRAS